MFLFSCMHHLGEGYDAIIQSLLLLHVFVSYVHCTCSFSRLRRREGGRGLASHLTYVRMYVRCCDSGACAHTAIHFSLTPAKSKEAINPTKDPQE